MIDRGVPRQHYEICDREGNKIGEVTSGTVSPVRRTGIGMGYVSIGYAKPDTEIFVKIRGRLLKAKTAKRI
jgi:aminomethyltransferase